MMQEMFVRARALGLEPYGSNVGSLQGLSRPLKALKELRTCTSWSMRAADIPRARLRVGWANAPSGPSPCSRATSVPSSRALLAPFKGPKHGKRPFF